MSKMVILKGSPQKDGNTDLMVDSLAEATVTVECSAAKHPA